MRFIDGIPDDIVIESLLPKLRAPLTRKNKCTIDRVALKDVVHRLRRCWATSAAWKTSIEDTAEWAAWRLARSEADQYRQESTGTGYSLVDIDPGHPFFGKADPIQNFRTNLNAFVRSKAIWVHCRRHPPLTTRELNSPMSKLTLTELLKLRNVLIRSVRGVDNGTPGQIWVTPLNRLD